MGDRDRIVRLAASLDRRFHGVVLIDALPGTGRRRLLKALTDIRNARRAEVSAVVLSPDQAPVVLGESQIVVARADQVANLDELRATGALCEVGNRDLFLSPHECPDFDMTAGWPDLDGVQVLPRDLPQGAGEVLHAILEEGVLEDRALSAEERTALMWLDPLVECRGGGWRLRTEGVADRLRPMLAHVSRRALASPEDRIAARLAAGRRREALMIFREAGGCHFLHLHGEARAQVVLDAFGNDPDPDVLSLAIMKSAKVGDLERALHLLANSSHPELSRLNVALKAGGHYPPQLVFSRILLAIYRSGSPREQFLAESSALLAQVDHGDHLLRGGVYNAVLELHIRAERYVEAEQTAQRALKHYKAGNAPYLCFFIHLHRAVIRFRQARIGQINRHVEAARRELDSTPFASVQDRRFLALLQAVAAYESGDPELMTDFALNAFEGFAYGEIWPSLATLALAFGAEALLQSHGLEAAIKYLDSWRVPAWRTRQFQVLIEQREVACLQSARHWREAKLRLADMASRIGRLWMDSSGRNLTDLRAPEDISQALLWLRQQAFESPRDPATRSRLAALSENPRLSNRQSLRLRLWQAWVIRRQGNVAEARKLLADALRQAESRGAAAPVLEERVFVLPLLEDRRMMAVEMRDAPVPRNLRRGAVTPFGTAGLSRQEWRVLLLLVEGCSNKQIAREMAISLPTVKFHLRNLYRKLDASDRQAAVARARDRELISA